MVGRLRMVGGLGMVGGLRRVGGHCDFGWHCDGHDTNQIRYGSFRISTEYSRAMSGDIPAPADQAAPDPAGPDPAGPGPAGGAVAGGAQRGRPRSQEADRAILTAAVELLAERG